MFVKLKVNHGPSAGKEIKIPRAQFLIGRGDECALRPKSDAISRKHCLILVETNQVLLRDLGSKNGTYVNGDRVNGDRILKPGDHLKVGPLEFEVLIDYGLGGDKLPKVESVAEAAARTFDSTASDADVTSWLEEADELDKARRAVDPETRQFKLEETDRVVLADAATREVETSKAEPSKAETVAKKQDESDAKDATDGTDAGKKGKKDKVYGKLPPRPDQQSATSRDAAADMLKKFFNRR